MMSIKFPSTLLDEYLDHMLVKFKQNDFVRVLTTSCTCLQNLVLWDKKYDKALTPFWNCFCDWSNFLMLIEVGCKGAKKVNVSKNLGSQLIRAAWYLSLKISWKMRQCGQKKEKKRNKTKQNKNKTNKKKKRFWLGDCGDS